MRGKRPLGITLIGYFYFWGAVVLIATLFTNSTDQFGIALRFGLPNIPENIMRILVSIISVVAGYGYLKLKKWGYWFMIMYSIYFLIVSIILLFDYKQQPFYGNAIWSAMVLVYSFVKRKCFDNINVSV